MVKRFNDTGICVANKHFMVDISAKTDKIIKMVEAGEYFTINRPRQFGKTTAISLLNRKLKKTKDYLVIRISFEGVGDTIFDNRILFADRFISYMRDKIELSYPEFADLLLYEKELNTGYDYLSKKITAFAKAVKRKVVLIIDEVDKSSNNQLFLHFLGMLRDKYLLQSDGEDVTFHSVILAGVHDIKSLKLKISTDSEHKLNSPWNIAVDFKVKLSFSGKDIESMLRDYSQDKGIAMNIKDIADKLYYYTSGYPYLVSKMCKIIDEEILPEKKDKNWTLEDVEKSFKAITNETYTTTLFDDLFKNLENNNKLYDNVFNLVINGLSLKFNINNPIINLGSLYGILSHENQFCKIHNRIFEQRIYNYFLSKTETENKYSNNLFTDKYFTDTGLNIKVILQRFQQFMKENYSHKDDVFLEREGRLLFMSFLKPIINGVGYDFKEPVVGNERQMDIVITYNSERYVIELKRWYSNVYHKKGIKQLSDYLDSYSLKEGFLLIYDFRVKKEYKEELIPFEDKKIFAVWV